MQLITKPMDIPELKKIASRTFGNLVKAVIDVDKKVVALDAELHADLEHFLLEQKSIQRNVWGVNLHPGNFDTDNFIEFDSMINLRPNQDNFSRSVDDPKIRDLIQQIIKPLFHA